MVLLIFQIHLEIILPIAAHENPDTEELCDFNNRAAFC
jgi:hypothetical protein